MHKFKIIIEVEAEYVEDVSELISNLSHEVSNTDHIELISITSDPDIRY